LIHRHRPDLIDYHNLDKNDKRGNMNLAFDIAAKSLNIPKLLDAEDLMDLAKPDERSVMTYVAQYFHAFSQSEKAEAAIRRIENFAKMALSHWEMQNDYAARAKALCAALKGKDAEFKSSKVPDYYSDAKKQFNEFNDYKNHLKREWVAEKRDLDALFGNIQTKLSTYKLAPYVPPAGLALADLDDHWNQLLKSEAARKKSLNMRIKAIKEQLQVSFATIANSLEEKLNKTSLQLAKLEGDLDVQTKHILTLQEAIPPMRKDLTQLQAIGKDCVAANIEENEYTIFSAEDLEFDIELVATALTKKLSFIQNQKVAREMTNLTPQQLEEFETSFRHFDKDLSNSLSSIEFKASLAGLGIAYAVC
jgi:hypothetical protein